MGLRIEGVKEFMGLSSAGLGGSIGASALGDLIPPPPPCGESCIPSKEDEEPTCCSGSGLAVLGAMSALSFARDIEESDMESERPDMWWATGCATCFLGSFTVEVPATLAVERHENLVSGRDAHCGCDAKSWVDACDLQARS